MCRRAASNSALRAPPLRLTDVDVYVRRRPGSCSYGSTPGCSGARSLRASPDSCALVAVPYDHGLLLCTQILYSCFLSDLTLCIERMQLAKTLSCSCFHFVPYSRRLSYPPTPRPTTTRSIRSCLGTPPFTKTCRPSTVGRRRVWLSGAPRMPRSSRCVCVCVCFLHRPR